MYLKLLEMMIKRQKRNHTQIQRGFKRIIFQSSLYVILRVLHSSLSLLSSVVGNILLTRFLATFGQEFDLVAVELQPTSYLAALINQPCIHPLWWPIGDLRFSWGPARRRKRWVAALLCWLGTPASFPKQALPTSVEVHEQMRSVTSIHTLLRRLEICSGGGPHTTGEQKWAWSHHLVVRYRLREK